MEELAHSGGAGRPGVGRSSQQFAPVNLGSNISLVHFNVSYSCAYPAAPSEPVGVAMASKHVGSQLIELSLSDKDFIAVSEEVSCRIVSWT